MIAGRSSAQESDTDVEYRVSQVAANAGGTYVFVPERWGTLHWHLANERDQPVELLCTAYFDSQPTLQYGRRVWLPARARLHTWHPIHVPPPEVPGESQIGFHTLVTEEGGSREILLRDDSGRMQSGGILRLSGAHTVTGLVSRMEDETEGSRSPHDVVMAARQYRRFPRRLTTLSDRLLPSGPEGLHPLDQLVLADDRMLGDAAALAAIRHWLYDGGKLWVMLDRVDPELLAALMGDESSCTIVDEVTLTHVEITAAAEGPAPGDAVDYERPVKLVRILLGDENDADVVRTVNGWPAAYWQNCGAGRLLVTTLESNAWVRARTESDPAPQFDDPFPYLPVPALEGLMDEFLVRRPEAIAATSMLGPHVGAYVGYSVPSRGLILSLLASFVGALGGIGVWLQRGGRLERLALVGPAVAVVVAGGLYLVGRQHRHTVPATTALLQIVRPIAGTNDARVSGSAGLFRQQAEDFTLGGTAGGWAVPQQTGVGGTVRRLIWRDLGDWRWENVPQVPGLQTAGFHVPVNDAERVEAIASFGPDGVAGRLSTPISRPASDPVVVTAAGRIGVDLNEDGTFLAGSENVLGDEQFLAGELLSDEQTRRSEILSTVLEAGSGQSSPEPTLYFWTDPWDAGLRFSEDVRQTGAALVAVPIKLRRPAAGTTVSLPSPWLPYRETSGPDGSHPSGLYDYRSGKWAERFLPSAAWLRIQIPPVLLPVDPVSARLTVRVTGPVGKLELSTVRGEDVVPLETWIDPVGSLSLELDAGRLPALDADGGLLLRIAGGDPDRPELTRRGESVAEGVSYWQIESVAVQMQAVVLEKDEGDAAP